MGVWMVIAIELLAGWLGYQFGVERGISKMENKRNAKHY